MRGEVVARRQARARARLPDREPRPRPALRHARPRRLRLPRRRARPRRRGWWVAAVNVGVRPQFVTGRGELIEAYLLDFDGDLYGQELRIEFRKRLRGEKRFARVDALVEQMGRDVEDAARERWLDAC